MKVCTKCKKEKELTEFYYQKKRDSYRAECKKCMNVKALQWYHNNKEVHKESSRRSRLKTIYGITEEDYNKLLVSQNNCCAICGKHEDDTKHNRLYVDHCHNSGQVRGLLCGHCNTGIGMLKDNKDLLLKAVEYLDGFGG